MRDLRRALSLLTTFPVHADWDDPAPLGKTMAWYPVVGLLIGLVLVILGIVLRGGEHLGLLRAAVIVVAWVVMTGGLHLDGWADACDGLLVTAERERRLEILKDPRVGSFGVIGLVLLLLVKTAAIAALGGVRPLLLAPVLGRWVVVSLAAGYPSARPGGLGDRFRAGLGARERHLALIVALLAAQHLGALGLLAIAVTWLTAHALARFAETRLGGLTGDVYGAAVELTETVVLVLFALLGG